MHSGTPMEERSTAGIILMFIVLPVLTGIAILFALVVNVATHGRSFTTMDWLYQVVWFGLLGLGVMTALPAAGWQELRRRKGSRQAEGKEDQAKKVRKPANDWLDEL